MLRAIATDTYTLNPGDLSWDALADIVDLSCYDRTPDEQLIPRCHAADILIVNKTVLTAASLSKLPKLKAVFVTATGYNNVEVSFLQKKNIALYHVKNYSTASVAQHVMACIFHYTNGVHDYFESVKHGLWSQSKDFSYSIRPIMEFNQKVIGIIGYGAIGKKVAAMAKALGLHIVIYSAYAQEPVDGYHFVSFNDLLTRADIICLCTQLTSKNEGMINAHAIDRMTDHVVLVNVARAQLIVESDLYKGLVEHKIAAAYLDVLGQEPPTDGNKLISLPNCFITPHIAWSSFESRSRLLEMTINNIKSFISGGANLNQII